MFATLYNSIRRLQKRDWNIPEHSGMVRRRERITKVCKLRKMTENEG